MDGEEPQTNRRFLWTLAFPEKIRAVNEYDDRTQLERLQEHIRGHLRWWKLGACNLSEHSERVASSWLYEHTIFDLVRIYKTFDWENKRLMFCGW